MNQLSPTMASARWGTNTRQWQHPMWSSLLARFFVVSAAQDTIDGIYVTAGSRLMDVHPAQRRRHLQNDRHPRTHQEIHRDAKHRGENMLRISSHLAVVTTVIAATLARVAAEVAVTALRWVSMPPGGRPGAFTYRHSRYSPQASSCCYPSYRCITVFSSSCSTTIHRHWGSVHCSM